MKWVSTIVLFASLFNIGIGQDSVTVKTGLDRVVENDFQDFRGKKLGIICNHSSVSKAGEHIIDLFHEKCDVKAIFAPEHGVRGDEAAGVKIDDQRDKNTGIKIYSLYGKIKKPTPEMLKNIDILVYDIQDIGLRFYTYISTLSYCMTAAAESNIEFIVLDRPNPLTGTIVSGPILEKKFQSFVGMHQVPIRYGLTVGEYATFINKTNKLNTDEKVSLSVVPVTGWKRHLYYNQLDLPWIAPSPNIPTLETAIVYSGMCFLEGTNLSEGRGTEQPFILFGAPYLDTEHLLLQLESLAIQGVTFSDTIYTPRDIAGMATNPKYEGQQCQGIKITITDQQKYRPIDCAVKILNEIYHHHRDTFKWKKNWIDHLTGTDDLRQAVAADTTDRLLKHWQKQAVHFSKTTAQFFLY